MADTRIIYDLKCLRWVACMYDKISGNVTLAISQNRSPLGLTNNWTKYELAVGETNFSTDLPRLGADSNGIYIAVNLYQFDANRNVTNWHHKVVEISKSASSCLTSVGLTNIFILTNNSPYVAFVLQPAVNFDSVAADGIAWFVAKGPVQLGTNYVPGAIQYGRLRWTNGTPQFLENPWSNSLNPPAYYDLDYAGFGAPQQPDGTNNQALALSKMGSRLTMAVVRSGALWTCHHVGLNSQGGYNGEPPSALPSSCQWVNLQ